MRELLLVLLLAAQSDTMAGQWVGPLEVTVDYPKKARGPMPTYVDVTQDGDKISGFWVSRPPNNSSGTIKGTIEKIEMVFYTDTYEGQPERCEAKAILTGRVTSAHIWRLTAEKMIPDERPQKECAHWPTDLVWTLQRAH